MQYIQGNKADACFITFSSLMASPPPEHNDSPSRRRHMIFFFKMLPNGSPWNSYQICKIWRVTHAPGMPETFSPPPRVNDPEMHHDTLFAHVPWCILGSLTSSFLWSRWRGKRFQHSRRMRNPRCYASGKRPILKTICCFMRHQTPRRQPMAEATISLTYLIKIIHMLDICQIKHLLEILGVIVNKLFKTQRDSVFWEIQHIKNVGILQSV